jgi:branched-chain amino acid aminotransferase
VDSLFKKLNIFKIARLQKMRVFYLNQVTIQFMYFNDNTFIYANGSIIKASEAKTDFYSQTLHYGYGVFEGIRSYETSSGATKIFKAEQHYERLKKSALALNLPYTWTSSELIAATYEILKINNLKNAYIRPLVYAPANMSFRPNEHSFIVIEAWEMQPFLGEQLLTVMTSSIERPNPKAFTIEAKATGHYVNSILASQEAKAKGFDEALMKDMNGFIAEAPGANFFIEKNGRLITPEPGHILPGITRATVFEICDTLGIPYLQKQVTPEDVLSADSAFFCGTAAEIIGIRSVDDYSFKMQWEESLGKVVQIQYNALVRERTNSGIFQTA